MKAISHSEMALLPDHILFQTVALRPVEGDTIPQFMFGCLCMKLPKRNGDDRYFQYTRLTEPEFDGIETNSDWHDHVTKILGGDLSSNVIFGCIHNSVELPDNTKYVVWEKEDLFHLRHYVGKVAEESLYYKD